MVKKLSLALLGLFLFVGIASALTVIDPGGFSSLNYTFETAGGNDSTFFSISRFATVRNATMNVSGLISPEGSFTGNWSNITASGASFPHGIDNNNTAFFIVDGNDDDVYLFNMDGTYTGNVFDLTRDGLGNSFGVTYNETFFWITDDVDDEVYIYNRTGNYTGTSWDTAASGNAWPQGITTNNSLIWITDLEDDEVYVYDMDGTFVSSWDTAASGNNQPQGITQDGTFIWITDEEDNLIYKYNMDGTYTDFSFPTTNENDLALGITQNGTFFWVTDDDPPDRAAIFQYQLNSSIFPANVSIDIGNDTSLEFFFKSELNTSNSPQLFNFTNFTTALQTYINITCTTSLCEIPQNISTNSSGVIQLDVIDIDITPSRVHSENFPGTSAETTVEEFNVTILFDTGENLVVTLIYNNTRFTSTQVEANTNNATYEVVIDIPVINGTSASESRTFFWNITDSIITYQSTERSHTVTAITLESCGGLNLVAVNFTLQNEFEPHESLTGDMDATFDIRIENSTTIKQYNFSFTNQPSFAICINPNASSFQVDSFQEYTAPGYSTRNYFLRNATLTNVTTNISLYLLNEANSTNILIQVTDDDGITGIQNVIGRVQRYFIGDNAFLTVAMLNTDVDGFFEVPLDTEGWYRFVFERNNVVELVTNPAQIQTSTLIFKLGDALSFFMSRYRTIQGLTYLLNFNDATNITTFFFNDPSSIPVTACLDVVRETTSGRTVISSNCEHLSSATLTSDLTGQTQASYFAVASVIDNLGNTFILDEIEILFLSGTPVFGDDGVFFTALTVGTVFLISIANPVAGIVLAVAALGVMSYIGMIMIRTVVLVGLAFIAAVIVYLKTRK